MCHSYEIIQKHVEMKKINKKEPFIMKKRATGIRTIELKIRLINS
jgi:hypothetical protein